MCVVKAGEPVNDVIDRRGKPDLLAELTVKSGFHETCPSRLSSKVRWHDGAKNRGDVFRLMMFLIIKTGNGHRIDRTELRFQGEAKCILILDVTFRPRNIILLQITETGIIHKRVC